jgi:hypothetical protein
MAGDGGRVGAQMKTALRFLYGARLMVTEIPVRHGASRLVRGPSPGMLGRRDLVDALVTRSGTSKAAAYAALARLTRFGFIHTSRGIVTLTETGHQYVRRRITWWGGPLEP